MARRDTSAIAGLPGQLLIIALVLLVHIAAGCWRCHSSPSTFHPLLDDLFCMSWVGLHFESARGGCDDSVEDDNIPPFFASYIAVNSDTIQSRSARLPADMKSSLRAHD